MTRKKIADNEPVVPAEGGAAATAPAKSPGNKARAPRASANSVTHKHKKAASGPVQSPATPSAVPVPSIPATEQSVAPVIPHEEPVLIPTQEQIAKLAYSYWEARGCQGGSMADDWFRAEQELLNRVKG